jgi:hypothetical protein
LLGEEAVHDFLPKPEICALQPVISLSEIQQAALPGAAQDAQSPRDLEFLTARRGSASLIIHEQEVRVYFESNDDSSFFARA